MAAKDILIIAHFTTIPGEIGAGRFDYLAKLLAQGGHAVETVTTAFSHRMKSQRDGAEAHPNLPYRLTMLAEPGYQRNVSLRRVYSHWRFGKALARYLKARKKPDIVYCAVPSLDAAHAAVKYAKRNGIRLVIDIQDLWPEAFQMAFRVSPLSRLFFAPMASRADSIYAAADAVVAVSQTFAARALRANPKWGDATVVFLGKDLESFDEYKANAPRLQKPEGERWMAYVGTLGHSYDLKGVMDAMALCRKEGKAENLRFIVMGDGPLRKAFEAHASDLCVPVTFMGNLPYRDMVPQLCQCDFAVNPIKKGSAASILNKAADYAAAGLPVINTQECREYRDLLAGSGAGINCENGNIRQLSNAIARLMVDDEHRMQMGICSRRLAEKVFDRKVTYEKIRQMLQAL